MVKNGGACLYKEARLNVEPAFPGSTIAFTLPASSLSTFGSRTAAKRTIIQEQYVDQDEESFARRHLATDGSVFFRQHHAYPRSFLWRVLDNRKMLEIQSVDLDHSASDKFEANLTLLFQFPSPIRPFCVAFAEPTDRDALTVFAITTANELYVLTIHRDFFANPAASEQDIEGWCKRSEPMLFSGRIPYRLVAVGVDELLVALDDGAICRMHWDQDNKTWDGSRYQHSNWSVRGLLSWKSQPTVRFDNADLAISASAAVAMSPDNQHILSVCLDHTIRAWNVSSGKLGVNMDLLGSDDRALEKANNSYFISPSQSTLLAVIPGSPSGPSGGIGGAQYHVVTYSPKQHRFRFWGVRDADDSQHGLYDICRDADLIPPIDELMNTSVWTLEEFHVIPGPSGWPGTQIWIRARSGPSSRVYSLKFDPSDDHTTLSQAWKHNWVSVNTGPLTINGLKNNPANPSERSPDDLEDESDLYQLWLDFLFFPGRFSLATLETALLILRKGLERTKSSKSSNRGSLKERICATVTALASSPQPGTVEVEQFEDALRTQWLSYYGLVKDLHKRRGESLSLAYDKQTDSPWLTLSDHLSAIRSCSDVEVSRLNFTTLASATPLSAPLKKAMQKAELRDVPRLLNAAASFRQRLPAFVQQEVQRQVEMDLLQSRSLTLIDRMEWVESHSELLQYVSDEDLSLLVEELGTEVKNLNTDVFLRAIQTLGQEDHGRINSRKQITRFGLKSLLHVSQETLEADHGILLDLLVLVLFMFVELEGETPDTFDASEVFVELIGQYKDCMTVSWLASNVWAHQTATGPASEHVNRTISETLKLSKKLPLTQTVLEGIYGQQAFELPLPNDLKANLLTHWSRGWIALVFKDGNYDTVVEDTMGILLYQKEYGLALDFSKFLPEGNWATYLKGRLHIALGENDLAAICFQKAAFSLSLGYFNVEDADTAGLVTEAERNSFSEGLASYYGHVIGIFEKAKAYSYVADFARLGLRSLVGGQEQELKTDLLQRSFTASVNTARFEEAYAAMVRHSDAALKHSSLQTLVTTMISQQQTTRLLKLPFVGLADDVDGILSSLCQKTLNLTSGPPYHQILYSFRIARGNFRGAASILHERLQRLKTTSSKHHDPADQSLAQCYLMIINTLSSVSKEDAYILAEQRVDGTGPPQWGIGQGKKLLKRQIITLDTLRKEYQAELDRVAAIESGQFPFVEAGDEMEIL
ncbi:nucleoporin Nup120/160-domain-containing protein [Paraphoma chrysanthemicola]|uniref:Nucleoporin Nup120/160-domain-containing protein n=1 Tax=Paraphoma chrysanthemicola TaxID=798071 RepID=A0A8K0RHK1_9PLEO|nr:nucleoporin Nup120/160-domain-containing protein [Paraphoma chrysanthemicola]